MAVEPSPSARLKGELKALAVEKESIEAEMQSIHKRLHARGQPGLKGSLVTPEGFPRADVDVHGIRIMRHRFAELSTDIKEVMLRLEQGLHALHTMNPPPGRPQQPATPPHQDAPSTSEPPQPDSPQPDSPKKPRLDDGGDAAPMETEAAQEGGMRPFAVIDEVVAESPGIEDGLKLGDQVVRFGEVSTATGDAQGILMRVAEALRASEGRPVDVLVLRSGLPSMVTVTPRAFGGRGLLGCHLRPLLS